MSTLSRAKPVFCRARRVAGQGSGRALRAWLTAAPHAWGLARRPRRGSWGAGRAHVLLRPVVGADFGWEDLMLPQGLAVWPLGVCTLWRGVPRVRAERPAPWAAAAAAPSVRGWGHWHSWRWTGSQEAAAVDRPTREPGWLPPSAVFGVPRVTGSALGDAPCSMSRSWPELSGNLCAHTSCSESARTYLLL